MIAFILISSETDGPTSDVPTATKGTNSAGGQVGVFLALHNE